MSLNKALLNPYFWGSTLGGGRLTSHETQCFRWCTYFGVFPKSHQWWINYPSSFFMVNVGKYTITWILRVIPDLQNKASNLRLKKRFFTISASQITHFCIVRTAQKTATGKVNPQILTRLYTSWWFQRSWKILVKLGIFPKKGWKWKYIWNHHPGIVMCHVLWKSSPSQVWIFFWFFPGPYEKRSKKC